MTGGLLNPTHIILLGLVALLIFGPKRIPEIGRSLGHGLRGFKDSVSGDEEKKLEQIETTPPTPVAFAQTEPVAAAEALPRPLEHKDQDRISA